MCCKSSDSSLPNRIYVRGSGQVSHGKREQTQEKTEGTKLKLNILSCKIGIHLYHVNELFLAGVQNINVEFSERM